MKIYTMGFTQKSAMQFFELLKLHGIQKMLDIRLNNSSQLAGFTKGEDLRYFLKEICHMEYEHRIELAPTKEILDGYKSKAIDWDQYEVIFIDLLQNRKIDKTLEEVIGSKLEKICLLCSEATPEKCHRRLVAEFIKNKYPGESIEIIHI